MSIVRAKTNPNGPATVDIQIEQGADFLLPMQLSKGLTPWDLTGCTVEAHFSLTWSPGEVCHALTASVVSAVAGTITIKFTAASSLLLQLPNQPRKTGVPGKFKLGGWVLNVIDPSVTDAPTKRIVEGDVYLDRDPCLE